MSDSFVETDYVSWGSKLKESIGGVIFGLILFVASFPVLFLNEGRAVNTAKALEEGAGAVISVSSESVDSSNSGKLVHMTGFASTEEMLTDQTFGIKHRALKLRRIVEMYLWVESKESKTEKKMGGGEERTTTYSYNMEWSSQHHNSANFKNPQGHSNPPEMPYGQRSTTASLISLGDFVLSDSLVSRLTSYSPLPVSIEALNKADSSLQGQLTVHGDKYYIGDPLRPEVGDMKIWFSTVEPQTISVVSQQANNSFTPYIASNGNAVELLQSGSVNAANMFDKAQKDNTIFTWIIRGLGCLLMFIGLYLIFRPLVVVADVIPIVGDLLDMGLGLFAAIIALPLSLITIAIAWIFYRPVIGIILLGVSVFILFKGFKMAKKRTVEATPTTREPPPIPE